MGRWLAGPAAGPFLFVARNLIKALTLVIVAG